eukprot:TRINITY_DN12372_c0_g1_i1.p1 TRINITY_DN12372_c0_g1~~TRINITY_DN12372_c0_g1_i1.p1  ORF type:complete len:207 (+),score=27.60 TRINITY_DN12372_c0_g1_i1:54-623(+)
MASPALRRLQKELQRIDQAGLEGISASVVGGDLRHWRGVIQGPPDSPFAAGTFVVDLCFPENYPFAPPEASFQTRIFHPNIYSRTGRVCLDILDNNWSPTYSASKVLLSVQALLASPNAQDPANSEAGQLLLLGKEKFWAEAAKQTQQYAVRKADAGKKRASSPGAERATRPRLAAEPASDVADPTNPG